MIGDEIKDVMDALFALRRALLKMGYEPHGVVLSGSWKTTKDLIADIVIQMPPMTSPRIEPVLAGIMFFDQNQAPAAPDRDELLRDCAKHDLVLSA